MFCQYNLKIHHVTSEMKVLDDEKYTLEAYLIYMEFGDDLINKLEFFFQNPNKEY